MLFLVGCSSEKTDPSSTNTAMMDEIKGRDTDGPRQAIYRMRVPPEWIRRDPLPNESLADTTKALCEFIIADAGGIIRIAIHNFPSETMEQRIPPMAQVVRWQRQFDPIFPNLSSVNPQSFSGYSGLLFTGVGMMKGTETMVLGWALQLAPEHYRTLSALNSTEGKNILKQMQADVTIKATGPRALIETHQAAIIAFAQSFELIEEIPPQP